MSNSVTYSLDARRYLAEQMALERERNDIRNVKSDASKNVDDLMVEASSMDEGNPMKADLTRQMSAIQKMIEQLNIREEEITERIDIATHRLEEARTKRKNAIDREYSS